MNILGTKSVVQLCRKMEKLEVNEGTINFYEVNL